MNMVEVCANRRYDRLGESGPSTEIAGGPDPTKLMTTTQSSSVGFTTRRTVRGEHR